MRLETLTRSTNTINDAKVIAKLVVIAIKQVKGIQFADHNW